MASGITPPESAMNTSASGGGALPSFTLPLFLTRKKKYLVGWPTFIIPAAVYSFVNHYPFVAPLELHRSWIDLSIPFLPNTIWIYMSELLFLSAIYIVSADMLNLNKFIYSYLCLQAMSCLIFWFWPTTYPRGLYPIPSDLNAASTYLFNSLRTADTPANCCPSLHVSGVYLSSFLYMDEQRKYFPFFFLWATAIALSTLTTKQHYLIDVIFGFGMAVGHYWFFHRLVTYRKMHVSSITHV
jgi:membrane-associated phospholipid phosphatase